MDPAINMTEPLNFVKFFEDIKNRPLIWHKDYPVKIKEIADAWTEISVIHGIPQRLLRAKWKHLREALRNELKKIPKTENNDFAISPYEYQSQWVHYEHMIFLVGKMRTSSVSSANASYSTLEDAEDDEEVYDTSLTDSKKLVKQQIEQIEQQKQSESVPSVKRTRKRQPMKIKLPVKKARYSARPTNATKPKSPNPTAEASVASSRVQQNDTGNTSKNTMDDDYHFLMSLYPYMSKLEQIQKLQVRMEIQNTIFKHLYSNGDF